MQAGPPRGWRGPGRKCFLEAHISKFFTEKFFFGQQPLPRRQLFREKIFPDVAHAFQGLYHTKFRYLAPKNKYLALCEDNLTHKNDWGPTKNFQGPPAPRDNLPPPLSAALHASNILQFYLLQ